MFQEEYSLTWQNYSDHLRTVLKELMNNEEFSDVTLVTEDKKQIKANIHVLSACSPLFKDILNKEKGSSTLMYLRGIQHSELESIIQFIYLGEATLHEERMDEVLAVAKSLEIKELYNAEAVANIEAEEKLFESSSESEPSETTVKLNLEQLLKTSDPDQVQSQSKHSKRKGEVRKRYKCGQCPNAYLLGSSLWRHNRSAHLGVRYPCDQCDYQATLKQRLTVHIQSRHDNIKYACDQCDYQATNKYNLTVHIQSIHDNIKYACDQCDYQATNKHGLTVHIQSRHDNIKYACDQCDHQATQKGHLNIHKKRKHKL